jgi:hypothetical protein
LIATILSFNEESKNIEKNKIHQKIQIEVLESENIKTDDMPTTADFNEIIFLNKITGNLSAH